MLEERGHEVFVNLWREFRFRFWLLKAISQIQPMIIFGQFDFFGKKWELFFIYSKVMISVQMGLNCYFWNRNCILPS
jgi:hypothetical protein